MAAPRSLLDAVARLLHFGLHKIEDRPRPDRPTFDWFTDLPKADATVVTGHLVEEIAAAAGASSATSPSPISTPPGS